MAKSKKIIWVYPSGDVWVVRKSGADKASAIRNTKQEAYDAARNIALNQNLTIKLKEKTGRLKTTTPRQARDEDCFITTACVKYFGLSDDCYQLMTLRKFRDNFMSASPDNRSLVRLYYILAPKMVSLIEVDRKKQHLYISLFERINAACEAIEKNKLELAKNIYLETIAYLLDYFNTVC